MTLAVQPIPLVDEGLGNSSYLLDLGDARALVVDAERDPGPYLAAAQRRGLTVAFAAETHERVLSLPGDLPVYPTHGAGSFCSAPAGAERTTTIGRERRANPLLAAPSEDAFAEMLLSGLGSYPPYFLRLREVNRRGPAVYGLTPPFLTPLDVTDVARLAREGALLVDARPLDEFAAGYVPGSLSIPLRDQFATWLGWLAGGIAAWADAGLPLGRIRLVPATGAAGAVVDVRQAAEWAAGRGRNLETGR